MSCVADFLPFLQGDKKCVESACLAYSRLIDNFQHNPDKLRSIAQHQLLSNMQTLVSKRPSTMLAFALYSWEPVGYFDWEMTVYTRHLVIKLQQLLPRSFLWIIARLLAILGSIMREVPCLRADLIHGFPFYNFVLLLKNLVSIALLTQSLNLASSLLLFSLLQPIPHSLTY